MINGCLPGAHECPHHEKYKQTSIFQKNIFVHSDGISRAHTTVHMSSVNKRRRNSFLRFLEEDDRTDSLQNNPRHHISLVDSARLRLEVISTFQTKDIGEDEDCK